jgi:peroxiredoxin
VELQSRAEAFARANTRIFAISYDSIATLARFAEQHDISYPLLSDEGSYAITELGLLNQHVAEQQAYFGRAVEAHHTGIPYPGTFLLDEQGVIVDKRFEQAHQARPAPELVLERIIGTDALDHAVTAQAEGTGVRALAWMAAATYRPMQLLRLFIRLEIGADLHIYGMPGPQPAHGADAKRGLGRQSPSFNPYRPLEIDLTTMDGLLLGPLELPEPHPFEVAGIDERFLVYEGAVQAALPVQLASNLGEIALGIDVRYHACTAQTCYPPETLHLELRLNGLDNLRPEPS